MSDRIGNRHVTIPELARAAGVSVASVNRALAGRGGVSMETVTRVTRAAERIGFYGISRLKAVHRPAGPPVRLGLVIPRRPGDWFFERLVSIATATLQDGQAERRPVDVKIVRPDDLSPRAFAETLTSFSKGLDCIAGVLVDAPPVIPVYRRLRASGLRIFSLLSEIAGTETDGFAGLDCRRMGRTAGWMMDRLTQGTGPLGFLLGNTQFHSQELCEIGFRAYFRDAGLDTGAVLSAVTAGQPEVAYDRALDILRRHPDIRGMFVSGRGVSGVLQARREAKSACPLFAAELTPETANGLRNGEIELVLATPLNQVASHLADMVHHRNGFAGRRYCPITIIGPENLDDHPTEAVPLT